MSLDSKKILSLSDYLKHFFMENENALKEHYPGIDLRIFLQKVADFCRLQQLEISSPEKRYYAIAKLNPLKSFLEDVLKGIPFEYLLGKSSFYRSEFSVGPAVLIPRSETEILVEYAHRELKKLFNKAQRTMKVADIGTGSGAIILSLLRECHFPVEALATDLCPAALSVARRNAFSLQYTYPVNSSVKFLIGDRLAPIDERQDMIVSNPPYIKKNQDRQTVHDQVDRHEPHLALYLEDEEYGKWYKEYFLGLKEKLAPEALFIMEGHEEHLGELAELAQACGLALLEVKKDYTQRNRFLVLKNVT